MLPSLLDRLGPLSLAEVTAVDDPDGLGRVEIRPLARQGHDGQSATLWARVAVPFAGESRGAFLLPDVGDEVLIAFLGGDPRFPVVLGSFWNGAARPPERLPGNRVDRWSLTGKAGTRIAIEEADGGQPTISLTTPGQVTVLLEDTGGGTLTCKAGGTSVTLDSSGATVQASGNVTVQGAQVQVSAGMVTIDAGMTRCSGVLQCDTLIATTVVASTYTPGAGNIW